MTEHHEAIKAKILIVEDEAVIALDLESRLRQSGYKVIARVNSGEKALEVVEQDPPDLVLMDIVLKGPMDGIEAAGLIHSRWGIPVIFVTAYADQERLNRAKLAYPFGYLLKPFEDRDIKITIQMALYFSKMEQEKKKTLEKIKESEERYRTIFERSNDGIALIEGNQHLEVNKRMTEIFGYDGPEEIIGQPLSLLIHPEDVSRVEELNQKRQQGLPVPLNTVLKGIRKDGRLVFVEVSATRILVQNQPASLVHIRDITEWKEAEAERLKLEDRVRRSEQMEAVGNLAKVIARDYSILFRGMQDHISTTMRNMEPSNPFFEHCQVIEEYIRNGVDLTRNLLEYRGKGKYELKTRESEHRENKVDYLNLPGMTISSSDREKSKENGPLEKIVEGKGTVLLVDDEETILKLEKKIIHSLGYEVLTANSGKEALEIYRKNIDRIKLVILDVVMPQMSGGETFDQLMSINPQVKILMTSGYHIISQVQEILNRGCQGFIEKPFDQSELSLKIEQVLGNS